MSDDHDSNYPTSQQSRCLTKICLSNQKYKTQIFSLESLKNKSPYFTLISSVSLPHFRSFILHRMFYSLEAKVLEEKCMISPVHSINVKLYKA